MKFTAPPKIREGYGNKRFKQVMDSESRLSRYLNLNLFPSRIWRRDAYIVLKTVGQALKTLEQFGHTSLDYEHFEFPGQEVTFYEVIAELHDDQTTGEE